MSRREFLYSIKFWEARRILRGYRKRGRIFMQLLAENVFASTYAFRGSDGNTPQKMFPMLFGDDNEEMASPLSEEDRNMLQGLIDAENARLQESSEE